MLNSKRDESIKRYLSRVGSLTRKSKLYESRYYKISYGDDMDITVRFSDHFKCSTDTLDINIIKTSVGFYVIKTADGMSITLEDNSILPYLRSMLLVFPEMHNTLNAYKKAAQVARKEAEKSNNQLYALQCQYDKRNEEWELADQILDENTSLQRELKQTKNILETIRSNYKKLSKKQAKIENVIANLRIMKNSLDNIFK